MKKMTALAMALTFLIASSVTRVEAAPTPDLTPQQMEAVIEDGFAGLVTFNAQRVVNHFASDAVLEDPVGTPPMVGTQAITAYLKTFPTIFNQMKLYSLDIKTGGQEAAVKWRLRFTTKTGNVFFLEGIGFFKFNEAGKFKRKKSSLISLIFSSNCRSEQFPIDSHAIDPLYKAVRAISGPRSMRKEDPMLMSRRHKEHSTQWPRCAAMCMVVCSFGQGLTTTSLLGGRPGQEQFINNRNIRH